MSIHYEVVAIPVPNPQQAKGVAQWLQKAAAANAELVAIMPTTNSGGLLAVFRTPTPGSLAHLKAEPGTQFEE